MCLLSLREFAGEVKNKQVVVGCWWTEKSRQIDDDIGRKRSGAGGMKDSKPGIIVHEKAGILSAVWNSRSTVSRDF
jgi:hypothetical protein